MNFFFCYLPIVKFGAMWPRIKADIDGINTSVYSSCNRVNAMDSEEIEDELFGHL